MIDERFSAAAFRACGPDTPEADALRRDLAAEIAAEMHPVIEAAFREIADRLRSLGHALAADPPGHLAEYNSWEYAFRDLGANQSSADHLLRIHFDTQVSTGYPNYAGPPGSG